jgi:streptogramin lyase
MEISRIPMFPHEMLSASNAAAARVIAVFRAMNWSSRADLKMTCRTVKTDRMPRQIAAKSQGSIMWYSSVSGIVFILPLYTTAPIINSFLQVY